MKKYKSHHLLLFVLLFSLFAGCGDDSPAGPDPEPEPEPSQGIISGTVTTTDGSDGIEEALLELLEQGSVSQEVYSEAEGKFSFSSVESGQYEVKMALPQGYRESGPTSKMIQVDNDVNIDFKGEYIQSETRTVKAGEQDTVATSSGAFVWVDASSASSDMEVTLSEVESETTENGSQQVKINIRPNGAMKSSLSPAKQMLKSSSNDASSVNVSFGQRVRNSNADFFEIEVVTDKGSLSFYADAIKEQISDLSTNIKNDYLTHQITLPSISSTEFFARTTKVDNTCKDTYRELKEYSSEDSGKIPIILIHGIQLPKGRCDEFVDFESLNLSDGDRKNTFDYLVEKLTSNINIDFDYKFYTYKYPSNTHIKEASDGLWNLIEDKNIKNPVLLAHSMGGLVARKMLIDQGEDMVKALITLGTPHKGTPLVKKLLNPIEFLENCPSDKAPIGCAAADIAKLLQAKSVPDTPGLRALKEDSRIVSELKDEQGSSDKIFTLGGSLGSFSAITDLGNVIESGTLKYQATYELGYFLMKIINGNETDGMVPLKSALPDWSTKIATLKDHDHTEMVRGENYDKISPNSVSSELTPLLVRLSGDGFLGESPTISSANSTPNPSTPGETANFTADLSGDEPIDCEWSFGNGATSTECNTTYAYQNTGTFDVSLTATNDGGSDTATLTHEVVQSGETNIIYVDADATGNNNGSSWDGAYKNLQDALAQAETGKEIWVAEGIYYPDQGEEETEGNREATFQLKNGVEIYGGFKGTETVRNERDWENNVTTLSGDIGIEDDMSDNSLHVVIGSNTANTAVLDGFNIVAGNANDYPNQTGGGMYNKSGNPIISNIIFQANRAEDFGGGLYNSNSNPFIENVVFINNSVDGFGANAGGGMYNHASSPKINKCKFENNYSANSGGGMFNEDNSNPSISNCSFIKNFAEKGAGLYNKNNSNPFISKIIFYENTSTYGGGIFNDNDSNPIIINSKLIGNYADESGGGIYNNNSSPSIIGTLFTGNKAKNGGGLFNKSNDTEGLIVNCTISENSSTRDGGGIFNSYSKFHISNSIIWGNNAASDGNQLDQNYSEIRISNSIIENGIPNVDNYIDEGNNLDSNPLFINAIGPDNIPGTMDDNLHLQSSSPAINAGLNDVLDLDGDGDTTDDVPVDLDGNVRIINGTVDIGAYETGGN
jgi:pimeloyl-ACP methyl ester carboxylesterase